MLDGLLGKADLKTKIEELEAERDSLEERLEAAEDRRRTAVRDRQTAEERLNQLEDRIAGLEGELETHRDHEETASFYSVKTIDFDRTADIITRLQSFQTTPESALTAGIVDEIPDEVIDLIETDVPLLDRARPCVLCVDDAMLVRVMLSPPRHPGTFLTWDDSFSIDRSWFLPSGRFTFAVVRSDVFAMGVYDGLNRQSFTGFTSDVMGRHSKGGFSQARFERRREEQIDAHREKVEEALSEQDSEDLILVGNRRLIGSLSLSAETTARSDASGKPEAALDDAFNTFWRTRVYLP